MYTFISITNILAIFIFLHLRMYVCMYVYVHVYVYQKRDEDFKQNTYNSDTCCVYYILYVTPAYQTSDK